MSLGDERRAPGDSPQQVNRPGAKHPLQWSFGWHTLARIK